MTTRTSLAGIISTRPGPYSATALGQELGVSKQRVAWLLKHILRVPIAQRGRHRAWGEFYPCRKCGGIFQYPHEFYLYKRYTKSFYRYLCTACALRQQRARMKATRAGSQ